MPKKIAPAVWLVLQELKKKLLQVMPEGTAGRKMLLAVSGGADSLALAHAAAQIAEELGLNLRVCHVEHGLRGQEALDDASLVQEFCQSLQLEYVCCHIKVKAYCEKQGCSLEEGARNLRYQALQEQAELFGAKLIVTAHHKDDQVETFFLKLLRGAGPEGLRGMTLLKAREGMVIFRPFLELERKALENYCREAKISYCQDSTNLDPAYTRNRIRLQLLPELEANYNNGLKENIVSTIKLLEEQEQFLKAEEDRLWRQLQDINVAVPNTEIALSVKMLKSIAPYMRKRLLRRAYFALGGKALSYERTEAIEKMLQTGVGGKVIQLPASVQVLYIKGKIVFKLKEKEYVNA